MGSDETAKVVDELYDAFLRGDAEGMLATFEDQIAFRFLGQVDGRGLEQARRFFEHAEGLLAELDFRIQRKIIDGNHAAITWTETATTAAGLPWVNHGVDVIEVRGGQIVSLHENNDVRLVHRHLEKYQPGEGSLETGPG